MQTRRALIECEFPSCHIPCLFLSSSSCQPPPYFTESKTAGKSFHSYNFILLKQHLPSHPKNQKAKERGDVFPSTIKILNGLTQNNTGRTLTAGGKKKNHKFVFVAILESINWQSQTASCNCSPFPQQISIPVVNNQITKPSHPHAQRIFLLVLHWSYEKSIKCQDC